MTKYHIKKDGLPGECHASPGNCPLGSDVEHYTNKADALAAAEEKLREENDYLPTMKKDIIYHINQSGYIEICKFRDGQCDVKAFGKLDNVHSANKSVIIGAATGMKAALSGRIPTKVKNNSPSAPSTTIPTKTTLKARSTIYSDWQKDWTAEEKKAYQDSCGHIIPSRFSTPIKHC